MSKGLAVIYDPHNLYQFVWYYCNHGKQKKWDALSLPNGGRGEYMHSFCEDTGIFEHVYRSDNDFSVMEVKKKCVIVAQMFVNCILGKQKDFCKKMLNQYVDLSEYDEIVVIADVGIISGACVVLGEEKEVVILEDGINDYSIRPRWIPKTKLFSTYMWQGFILARMGYCSPGWFAFDADRFCIKYCSQPDKMKYRKYKEMRQLYAEQGTDWELFQEILRRMYPALENYDLDAADAVLFTRPLEDYVPETDKYQKKLEDYINKKYSNIILKKHPRECGKYEFSEKINVQEIDNAIPAEALLSYLKGKDILMVTPSAIIMYMKAYNLKCKIITFAGLYEDSLSSNSNYKPLTDNEVVEFGETFAQNFYEVINL